MTTGSSSRGDEVADRVRSRTTGPGRAAHLALRPDAEPAPPAGALPSPDAGLVASTAETVSGVLEDAGARGGEAWAALRSQVPALPARRWPWAVGAALAGATAGAAVAYVVGRLSTPDAPDALEPEQVQAVVDRALPAGAV